MCVSSVANQLHRHLALWPPCFVGILGRLPLGVKIAGAEARLDRVACKPQTACRRSEQGSKYSCTARLCVSCIALHSALLHSLHISVALPSFAVLLRWQLTDGGWQLEFGGGTSRDPSHMCDSPDLQTGHVCHRRRSSTSQAGCREVRNGRCHGVIPITGSRHFVTLLAFTLFNDGPKLPLPWQSP